ncbi:14 kDa phosphohistidine phosphatase-like isoform X1 [Thrips palmi]|uniref:Sex-regulated protein janus-A n=2 Tax=Thrips palmi TaxID=161013 RepID=A0A6P8ZRB4_THRPL|nr:14 kDa phosphohistidine phosphatase-like isoform X1 [Thrips palmi]
MLRFARLLVSPTFKPCHLRLFAAMADALNTIPTVSIDNEGVFKYVLIKVHKTEEGATDSEKFIVRGFKWGPYHADIYEATQEKIEKLGFETECVGGGRIEHNPSEKKLKVYGYSQGYGRADHEVTTELLKKEYPDYNVSWTNDGY